MPGIIWTTKEAGEGTLTEEQLEKLFPKNRRYVLNRSAEKDYKAKKVPENERNNGYFWFAKQVAAVLSIDPEKLNNIDCFNLLKKLAAVGLIGWSGSHKEQPNYNGYVLYPGRRDKKFAIEYKVSDHQ